MPKNILILTDWIYPVVGGTEQHCFGLARYLVKKGYNVTVLSPNWKPKKEVIEAEGVKIIKFGGPLQKIGIVRIIYFFLNYLKLKRNSRFDLIHSFYFANNFIAGILIAKIERKKCVITLFEVEPLLPYLSNPLGKKIMTRLLGSTDFITTLNWTLEEKIKELLPEKKNKIKTIPNWVDLSIFKETKKVKKEKKDKRILFVGRLCEQKGCDLLIKALPRIRAKINAKLVFVGPPWKQNEFEELARELKVEKHVEFKGFLKTKKELNNEYNIANVVTYPTREKGGFGFTILEALASGKPVVGSDDTGIPDAIGNAGLVARRGDEKDLAEKIVKILSDKKFYERLQRNAFNRAKLFEEKRIIEEYVRIYESI